jgi:hypothetical protein
MSIAGGSTGNSYFKVARIQATDWIMRKPLRKCGKDAVAQKGGFEYSAIEKYRSYLLVAAMLGQKRGKMPGYGCI